MVIITHKSLCRYFTAGDIDIIYRSCFPEKTVQELWEAACRLQALVRGWEARHEVQVMEEPSLREIRSCDAEKIQKIINTLRLEVPAPPFADELEEGSTRDRSSLTGSTSAVGRVEPVLPLSEAKSLFHKVMLIPFEKIPDTHREVMMFVGLNETQLIDKMCLFFNPSDVDQFFVEQYRNRKPEEKEDNARRIQGVVRGWSARHYVKDMKGKSILKPTPDRVKIEAIVKALDVNDDGKVSVEEAKLLFSELLNIPMHEIPDDHQEVIAFAAANTSIVDRMVESFSQPVIDQYYEILYPESMRAENSAAASIQAGIRGWATRQEVGTLCAPGSLFAPNKSRIRRIVDSLDTDGDGTITLNEIKFLFSRLLDVPEEEIGDDHREVVAFVSLPKKAMVEKLANGSTKSQVLSESSLSTVSLLSKCMIIICIVSVSIRYCQYHI